MILFIFVQSVVFHVTLRFRDFRGNSATQKIWVFNICIKFRRVFLVCVMRIQLVIMIKTARHAQFTWLSFTTGIRVYK